MEKNKYVFMDVTVDGHDIGRIEIELYMDVPIASYNFKCLCTGEKGQGLSKRNLHYKGTKFHRIFPGTFIQGGDITVGDGSGGESIYGY